MEKKVKNVMETVLFYLFTGNKLFGSPWQKNVTCWDLHWGPLFMKILHRYRERKEPPSRAYGRVSQNEGYLFGAPYNKDYSIFGSTLESTYFGKLSYTQPRHNEYNPSSITFATCKCSAPPKPSLAQAPPVRKADP